MIVRSLGCMAIFFVAGCVRAAPDPDPTIAEPQTIDEMRARSLAAIDRAACEASGGAVVQDGMMGLWRCTTPYPDAGAPCRDADDCAGRCVSEEGVTDYEAAPGEAKGVC